MRRYYLTFGSMSSGIFCAILPTAMPKNRAAVALGRIKTPKKAASSARNARKATKARMRLTPEARSEQARKAVQARWAKHK